jgi:hypothetical protein
MMQYQNVSEEKKMIFVLQAKDPVIYRDIHQQLMYSLDCEEMFPKQRRTSVFFCFEWKHIFTN